MKRLLIFALGLVVLGAILFWVSLTGGLPEPYGSFFGQHLSRAVHFIFLLLSIAYMVFGPLQVGEQRLRRVLWTAGAVAINFAVVETLKHVVFWPRPVDVGETAASASRGSGFPSGHTVPVFIIAVMVGTVYPRLQIPALLMAILIGYSRAEVTAHFPIQVFISAVIGMVLGLLWTQARLIFIARGRKV